METFSTLLALCVGNSPVTGEIPSQRPVTQSFDFSLICVWINGWIKNHEAGDLRRHSAHYDVTVMIEVAPAFTTYNPVSPTHTESYSQIHKKTNHQQNDPYSARTPGSTLTFFLNFSHALFATEGLRASTLMGRARTLHFCTPTHYSDVTWGSWRLNYPATRLLIQQHVQTDEQKDQNIYIIGPYWGESTGGWGITLTKDK